MATKKSATKKSVTKEGRDKRGRFGEGNPGGPGRPRRAVEREYLAVLSDALSLARWRKIVNKVASRADQGERWAVEWLSRYLLGDGALSLTKLAAREALGIEADYEVAAEADKIKNPGDEELLSLMLSPSVLSRALKLKLEKKKSQALERIGFKPELQPYREVLEQGASWNFDNQAGYWEWVTTAPTSEIVAWAKESLEDGASDPELAALLEQAAAEIANKR